ncbi:S8 family peptidase [Fictibacillus iocasae]|uniref:S8 family peptidase n=1 Tax=Fictibacillus iocasae TaxID=2715437 RepID=A0ABW2NPU0_9BACL
MDWILKSQKKLDEKLLNRLKSVQSNTSQKSDPIPLLIRLTNEAKAKKITDLCSLTAAEKETHNISEIHFLAGRIKLENIRKLADHADVAMLHLDAPVKASLDVATPSVGGSYAKNAFGLTGKGVTIAVLDTGIHPHPDFVQPVNRIVEFVDFVQGRTTPYDDNGHGTHCAGCAAGNGIASGGKYVSPAPEATLVGVKVLNATGDGSVSTVIAGINYCIQNKARLNIKIMNLSLGVEAYTSYINDPLAQACESAFNAGILVIAAAGNSGPDGKVNSPGIHPRVLTVGAIDDRDTVSLSDDIKAAYTSVGPTIDGLLKPDLFVPGSNITAPISPNSTLTFQYPGLLVLNGQYMKISGTSMATGLCSGAAALMLQAYPSYSPQRIKLIMLQTIQVFNNENEARLLLQEVFKLTTSQ